MLKILEFKHEIQSLYPWKSIRSGCKKTAGQVLKAQPFRLKQTAGRPPKTGGRPAEKSHYILADWLHSYEVAEKCICEVENHCSFDKSAEYAEDVVQYTDHRQAGEYVYGREYEVEYTEGARHYNQ